MFCELTFELLIPICWLQDVILCWGIPPGLSSLEELSKQRSGFHPRQLPVLPAPLLSPGFSLLYTWILPHHHLLRFWRKELNTRSFGSHVDAVTC